MFQRDLRLEVDADIHGEASVVGAVESVLPDVGEPDVVTEVDVAGVES